MKLSQFFAVLLLFVSLSLTAEANDSLFQVILNQPLDAKAVHLPGACNLDDCKAISLPQDITQSEDIKIKTVRRNRLWSKTTKPNLRKTISKMTDLDFSEFEDNFEVILP